ncbi:MAG: cytidine deaminase, partial [Acutalibacteraceae bacterium]|nr:cytidine deaminase [Acutalibacteraceae bacterium]
MKRNDYISWDEYFMGVAILSAQRSKDPGTQVGACIVSDENRIMTVGYNGMPRGCSDDDYPWDRVGDVLDTKYAFVCHAELNA